MTKKRDKTLEVHVVDIKDYYQVNLHLGSTPVSSKECKSLGEIANYVNFYRKEGYQMMVIADVVNPKKFWEDYAICERRYK